MSVSIVCRGGRERAKGAAAAAAELVMSSESSVIDEVVEPKSPVVGGGVQDPYGEDRATEDQYVTPWSVSVARYNFFFLPALVDLIGSVAFFFLIIILNPVVLMVFCL